MSAPDDSILACRDGRLNRPQDRALHWSSELRLLAPSNPFFLAPPSQPCARSLGYFCATCTLSDCRGINVLALCFAPRQYAGTAHSLVRKSIGQWTISTLGVRHWTVCPIRHQHHFGREEPQP